MEAHQLIQMVRPAMDEGGVPGAVVGVVHHGRSSLATAGRTEPGGATAMPADAVMRISSNTKPMVAAVALLLAQDGVLNLDDDVERFVPELTGRRVLRQLDSALTDTVPVRRSMTIEDLLTMRMGFGFVFESACPALREAEAAGLGFGPPDPSALPSPDEWMARFASLPLLEQPGTVWRYELAFGVLGVVLARATGRPLDVVMRERLFTLLAMSRTGFVASPQHLVPSFAHSGNGLTLFDGTLGSRWSKRPTFLDARGGLVSTVGDVLRFARMLLDGGGGLLSPELVAAMTSDRLTAEQRSSPSARAFLEGGGWGYGVGVTDGRCGRRYGWGGGLGTLWYSWPEHGAAAVVMTQVSPPSARLFDAFTNAAEATLVPSWNGRTNDTSNLR